MKTKKIFVLITIIVLSFLLSYASGLSSKSIQELQAKAKNGDINSQYQLGKYYDRRDIGVVEDYKKAVIWYRKAAVQGHAKAQTCLGYCYEVGQGVNKNINEAIKWYKEAAAQGE